MRARAGWGRAQETYGESPMHNGAMCAAFIRGLQGNHSSFIKIAATVKHFAFCERYASIQFWIAFDDHNQYAVFILLIVRACVRGLSL